MLRHRLALQLQVGLQKLLDRLADAKAPEHLEVGQTVEEQDAFGEAIRMLHLADRFVPLELGEPLHAPIVEHAIVQPILIDRGELILQRLVQIVEYLGVALHAGSPLSGGLIAESTRYLNGKTAENSGKSGASATQSHVPKR